MQTNFDHIQQALDTAFGYYDRLREQGKSHADALNHVVQRFGVNRDRLATLLAER